MTKCDTLEVHNVGTTVTLTDTIDAKIVAISIRDNNYVQYECAWWNGSILTEHWFTAGDFLSVGEKDTVTKIGFIRNNDE